MGLGIGIGIPSGGGLLPFTPRSISGCVLWLRADLGITKDGSDRVSAWADQSGSGADAAQATGSKQPLWIDATLGGKPVIQWDGDDVMVTPNQDWGAANACTVFAVYKNTSGALEMLLDKGSQSAPANNGARLELNVSAAGKASLHLLSTGAKRYETSAANPMPINTWHILSATADVSLGAAESVIYDEGTAEAMTAPGDAAADIGANNPYGIGGYSNAFAANEFTGQIAELVVYTRALSDAERQQVERYLGARYGITVA